MKSLACLSALVLTIFLETISAQDRESIPKTKAISVEEIDFEVGNSHDSWTSSVGNLLGQLKQVTLDDLLSDTELETWKAPSKYSDNFCKYYLSGYDEEDRPIWIIEAGRINLRDVLDGGMESLKMMDKVAKQLAYRLIKSFRNSTVTGEPVTEIMYIEDVEGFDLRQIGHLPSVRFLLRLFSIYRDLITEHLAGNTVINANAFLSIFVNLLRPIFREAEAKVDIFGTNKERWIPVLRSKFPIETLPPWYGGRPGYKPLAVY